MYMCPDINLIPSLTGSSVAGGLRTLHFSRAGRQPGCMAHSKTYNSLVLLLMSQDGAVLQSNPPILSLLNMTLCTNSQESQYRAIHLRRNTKREGFCEIYNVRPLAILAEEGSHSNAPLNKNPTIMLSVKTARCVTCHAGHTPVSNHPTNYQSKCYSIRILYH